MILPEGPGVRNDVGVSEGQEVTSSYDPLLAKLVVWDSDRASAIARMDQALSNFVILGLITNQPFLRDIMNNSSFSKASFSTNFINENFPNWKFETLPPEVLVMALLGTKATVNTTTTSSRDPYSPWSNRSGWRPGL